MFPKGTQSPSTSAKRSQNDADSAPKKQKLDYPKGGLVHTLHGDVYQLKLLMLFVLRGLNKEYSFRLATEWNAAEKFDDLVFEYKDNGKTVYRFVQAKHKQNECKRVSEHDLLTQKDDDFSLQKYFISYRKIRSNQEFNGPNDEIKDIIICTNIDLSDDLQNSFERVVDENDDIIHVAYNSKESKLLKYRNGGHPLSKERLVSVFQEASDFKRLAEKLASHVFGNDTDKVINLRDELFKKYHAALAEHVVDTQTKKFKFDFINGTSVLSKEVTKFRKVLLDKSKLKSEDEFKKQLQIKDLKISDKFGKIFKIDPNPEISKKEIKTQDETSELAQKIAGLICAANPTDIVTIEHRALIIKENISKLAGHVLIETEDEKIMSFRKGFLDGNNLPGNLNDFRHKLKEHLGTKFSQLGEYQFKNNIHACTAIDYEKYTKDNSYFERLYCLADDEVSMTEIDDFLDKLVLSVDHPNEVELSEVIKKELGFNNIDRKNVYSRFLEKMLDWMKKEKGHFISYEDATVFFDRLKKEILGEIWFNVRQPVRLFTGRKKQLSQLHDAVSRSQRGVVVSHMTSVSGLGGIGKSELVRMYASSYLNHYDGNIIGINAESYETLRQSFFDLANDVRVGIPTENNNGKEKTTEALVEDIYKFFSKRKSLFIFDNAEQGNVLNKFLPLSCLSPHANKPSFVITSRDREWEDGIQVIELNELEIAEAIEFVKRGLEVLRDDTTKDEEIERLVKKLQCFPLAIQQAIAYIRYQDRSGDFDIDDYIKEYDKTAELLLNSEIFIGTDNNYAKTTFTTWQITTDRISKDKEHGQLALKILDVLAYYASDNIKREIFLSLADKDLSNLKSAVRLLVRYSMVNGEEKQSLLSVHRLVQDVTRLNMKECKSKVKETIGIALKLLEENFPYGKDRREDFEKKRQSLPHCEALLSNVDDFIRKSSAQDRKQVEETYWEDIVTLSTLMADGYTDLGNNERRKILLERALGIQKDQYGCKDVKVAITQRCLGNAHGDLGNPTKQKELLESTIDILKGLCRPDDIEIKIEIAKTMSSLGNAYGDLADCPKKKMYLEQAKPIYEAYYGVNSVEVARMVNNLGNVCGELGDPNTQKELIEKALPILRTYYGDNHFQVGRTLNNLSNAFSRLGLPREQKKMLEEALVIYENHYGQESYLLTRAIRNLGTANEDLGNYHEQKRLLKKALRIQEKEYGVDNFEIGRTLNNLSNAYRYLGKHEKQKELLERAQPIFENRNFELAIILGNLGTAYCGLDNHLKGKKLLEESLEIKEKHYGRDNNEITETLRDLGICYGKLGQHEKQMELLQRTFKIQKDHYESEEHWQVAITLSELGYAYGSVRNYQHEKDLLERALPILVDHFGCDDHRVTKIQGKLNDVSPESATDDVEVP